MNKLTIVRRPPHVVELEELRAQRPATVTSYREIRKNERSKITFTRSGKEKQTHFLSAHCSARPETVSRYLAFCKTERRCRIEGSRNVSDPLRIRNSTELKENKTYRIGAREKVVVRRQRLSPEHRRERLALLQQQITLLSQQRRDHL